MLRRFALGMAVVLAIMLGALILLGMVDASSFGNLISALQPRRPLIGLIAGHWQNDSGAVCPDGLQEVSLNLDIARQVAYILRQEGYRVQVLPEFSPELNGYQAAALLSIHCDSCVSNVSGFKIVRMTHSANPEAEDVLVDALYESYALATGLEPHPNSITEDMRQYHALRQADPQTPGAIIECGFMGSDRYLLTEEQDRVAVGIANGLMAFLRAQEQETENGED